MAGSGAVMVYSRADCLSIARTCMRTARHYLPGGIWESWGEDACALGFVLELTAAIAWRELARNPAREDGARDGSATLLAPPAIQPRKVARAKEAKRRELELDLGDFAKAAAEPWRPPPAKAFDGQWHWDDVRASIDAVIAHLPEDNALSRRLDMHDTQARHDSTLVYRWGVELGKLWKLPDPSAYGRALTNSAAIHRPSLATREDRADGIPPVWSCDINPDRVPTVRPTMRERWEAMVDLERARRGDPTIDDGPVGITNWAAWRAPLLFTSRTENER